jgi:nitrate/nitrite-specific signal transduction histidine kinase
MRTFEIDSRHSRAIVREIGEGLRASFKEDRELPVSFRKQIERLRQSESEARANLARSSRRDKS